MSRIVCVGQICGGLNWVFSHCIPQEDYVHTWDDMMADAQANPNTEGTGKDVILL